MNFESQNVDIPGLALLKAMVPPHHAPVTPLVSQKMPRYTGPRKSKFALRKQAQVESQAQVQARAFKDLPPRPEQSFLSSSSSSPSLSSSNFNNNNNHFNNNNNNNSFNNNTNKPDSPSLQPDGRQVPSKESGGVPDPTPLYLAQSLAPPSRLPQPRRILVIMDLNGTLLYRPNKKNPFNFVERPHARQFLSYCLDTFFVAIWSSARPQNVGKMVAQLLSPQQREQCVVTWARDRFGLSPADYDARVQCYKRLTALWADKAVIASHPAASLGQRWDQTNTVLVDDSVEKARTEPHNILEIPEFSGVENERSPLVLPQVHDYLNLLSYQSDISRFIRQQPFKLDGGYRLDQPRGPPGF